MKEVAELAVEPLSLLELARNVELSREVGWQDRDGDWRVLHEAGRVLGIRGDRRLLAQGALGTDGAAGTIAKMVVAPDAQRRGLRLPWQAPQRYALATQAWC